MVLIEPSVVMKSPIPVKIILSTTEQVAPECRFESERIMFLRRPGKLFSLVSFIAIIFVIFHENLTKAGKITSFFIILKTSVIYTWLEWALKTKIAYTTWQRYDHGFDCRTKYALAEKQENVRKRVLVTVPR